jgi:hypothetical protein
MLISSSSPNFSPLALTQWVGARIKLPRRKSKMRLLIEAVIVVVVIYIAVRLFMKRG